MCCCFDRTPYFRGQESNLRPPGSKPGVTATSNCPGAEAVGLEPTSGRPPLVFKTSPSSGRSTSVCVAHSIPGAGIEPAASWFRARRHYQQQLPRNRVSTLLIGHTLASSGSHILLFRVPCGSQTRLSGLEDRCLGRSAKGTSLFESGRRGVEPPRPIARPLSRRVPSPVGLPFRIQPAPAAGIEPASSRLTAGHPYQHEHHRNLVSLFSRRFQSRIGSQRISVFTEFARKHCRCAS
jgi:hypothetical protein